MSGDNGSVRRKVHDAAWEPVTSIEMEALRLLELIGDVNTDDQEGVRAPHMSCLLRAKLLSCSLWYWTRV